MCKMSKNQKFWPLEGNISPVNHLCLRVTCSSNHQSHLVRCNKKNTSLKAYNNVLKIVISGVISMIMNFLLKIFNVMHYYYLCGKNLPTCNRQMDQQTDGKSRLRGYEQGGRPMPYRWAWEVLQEGRGSYMGGCGLFTTRLDRAVILMHAFTRSLVN